MKLKEFVTFIPSSLLSTATKTVRRPINDEVRDKVVNEHLYHVTSSLETAEKIMESGELRASKNVVNSYGSSVCCFFAGKPNAEDYIKNITMSESSNILFHPEKVIYAVELDIHENELANFKDRSLSDGAILHEGNCILPEGRTKIKQLVLDVIRDRETGEEKLGFRERTKEEIENDPKEKFVLAPGGKKIQVPGKPEPKHTPSKECLEMIEEYKTMNGYSKFKGINTVETIVHQAMLENKYQKGRFRNFLSSIFSKRNKELDTNPNDKVKNLIDSVENGTLDTRRPVRDEKYVDSMIALQKSGIKQKKLSEVIPELLESKEGEMLRNKQKQIDPKMLKGGIHGIKHADRVALLSMAIINSEEYLPKDNRVLELASSAAYFHDVGRITDNNPHGKLGASFIESGKKFGKELDICYSDGTPFTPKDRKILQALTVAHSAKSTEKVDKIMDKYGIADEDKDMVRKLNMVLRDADALDRARISKKTHFDLNPNYLNLKSSKEFIDMSFDLEKVRDSIDDFSIVTNYDAKEAGKMKQIQRNEKAKGNNEIEAMKLDVWPPEMAEQNREDREEQTGKTLSLELPENNISIE